MTMVMYVSVFFIFDAKIQRICKFSASLLKYLKRFGGLTLIA